MPINRYCWRCGMVVPMLTEGEWAIIEPTLNISRVKAIREKYGVGILEAGKYLCDKYNEITGSNETNVNAIWHHRNSLFGKDCVKCGKPYRTPEARYCVECGDGIEGIG